MNINKLIRQYREIYPAEYQLGLRFGDCKIKTAANDRAITDALAEYFHPFTENSDTPDIYITIHEMPAPELPISFTVKPPDPGKTKIKEEYADMESYRIVRKRLTGMIFIFGQGEHLAAGPCLQNLNQVVNFINNRYIEWKLCRGCLLGHAAGVIWKGKGLALAGFSGAGKSTLSLHLMNHGAVFVSNDRLMIEKNGKSLFMYGVAKLPRINPGTVLNNPNLTDIMPPDEQERFSRLSKEELWHLEYKYDAPIDKCFGSDRFVLSSHMHGLVILNWKKEQKPAIVEQVDLSERKDLLPAFMKSTGLFFLPHETCRMPEPNIQNYIDHLSLCKVWEITGGTDFDHAARSCISLIERC